MPVFFPKGNFYSLIAFFPPFFEAFNRFFFCRSVIMKTQFPIFIELVSHGFNAFVEPIGFYVIYRRDYGYFRLIIKFIYLFPYLFSIKFFVFLHPFFIIGLWPFFRLEIIPAV